jgi:sulfur-carrier protein
MVMCHESTVRDVIEDCCKSRPQLGSRLVSADGQQVIGIFLNGRSIRQVGGLDSPVADGDEIRFLPPIVSG